MFRLTPYLLLFIILTVSPALSNVITGKVVSVSEGDTITILDQYNIVHTVRLYGVDSPEIGQAFGNSAKQYTSSQTTGKRANVTPYDTDTYGRTVGVADVSGLNINRSLIEAGYAWQYRAHCKESFCTEWLQLEREARVSMRGLWNFAGDPVPPWEWKNLKQE